MAEYFAGGHLRFLEGEWRDDNGDVVNIAEVQYGEWDWYPNRFDRQELLCTRCEEPAPYNDDGEQIRAPYCPNCGANMSGGKTK